MKHAAGTIIYSRPQRPPKHSKGWSPVTGRLTDLAFARMPYTPGRHAKPFAAHHPARPVTYDATGATTPLNPPTHKLDVAA